MTISLDVRKLKCRNGCTYMFNTFYKTVNR